GTDEQAGAGRPGDGVMTAADTGAADHAATVTEMTGLFVKALRALGKAGDPVTAGRLGGKAWWVLGDEFARDAERVNGTMHYLARLEEKSAGQHSVDHEPDNHDLDERTSP